MNFRLKKLRKVIIEIYIYIYRIFERDQNRNYKKKGKKSKPINLINLT